MDGQKGLGEILIEEKLLTKEQLAIALAEQKKTNDFLGVILERLGFVKKYDILKAVALQRDMPFRTIGMSYLDWGLVSSFQTSLILEHKCFPLSEDEATITMAITDPLDMWVMQKAQEEARGKKVMFVVTTLEDMELAIKRYRQFLKTTLPGSSA